MDAMVGSASLVLHVNEQGAMTTDVATASEHAGQAGWAQKYGRFYVLSIVRWLSDIFNELVRTGTYGKNIGALFGQNEFFTGYRVPDGFLLSRKLWPLK
jgi:hypothetical protein